MKIGWFLPLVGMDYEQIRVITQAHEMRQSMNAGIPVVLATLFLLGHARVQGFWLALSKSLMSYDLKRFVRVASHGFDGLGEGAVACTA